MLSEQESEAELCPWQTALEQFLAEFMQFFYPAAWAEIDWQRETRVLPLNLPQDCMKNSMQSVPAAGRENGSAQAYAASMRRAASPLQSATLRPALASLDLPLMEPLMPTIEAAVSAPLQHLVQVYLRNGQQCRLFIYLGWQFESRQQLAQHMYRNQCALYGECAQPVASFAVLAGAPAGRSAPPSFAWECLGNQLGMYFPSVYFNDFLGQEAALGADDNAFALLTLAQLVCQQTAADMPRRYCLKWQMIQSMFERGWSRERIIVLFLALDWSLPLPLRWSAQLWREIEQFEEQQIMRYVSSVERFIRERERQQGYQQGEATMLQHLLVQRFGELPLWVGMQIQGGNGEQRLHWLQRALAAHTLEDVFHEEA